MAGKEQAVKGRRVKKRGRRSTVTALTSTDARDCENEGGAVSGARKSDSTERRWCSQWPSCITPNATTMISEQMDHDDNHSHGMCHRID
jgi:hypothetical protein